MRRVLIVEDDRDIAEMLSVMLRMDGMDVRTVNGGSEALLMLEGFAAEAVVTDLNMARMDGLELCRALRGSADYSAVPVLIYTAVRSDDARLVEALTLAGVEVATKPLGAAALVGRVRALLEVGADAPLT